MEIDELRIKIGGAKHVILYGAQPIAYGISKALLEFLGVNILCYAVTNEKDNLPYIDGVPVHQIDLLKQYSQKSIVLIATPEIYHNEIIEKLRMLGFETVLPIDNHLEYLMMSYYLSKKHNLRLLSDYTGNFTPYTDELKVFMAKCHVDIQLRSAYDKPEWIVPIQVGADLNEIRIADITDNTGLNISKKNRNYCELTATYWAWKNNSSRYIGICHYRRVMLLESSDLAKLQCGKVDVLLPLPFLCWPDAATQYSRYISPVDFEMAIEALKISSPQYFEAAKAVFRLPILYNYNMLIAKREVFDEYCTWLFAVLKEVEYLNNDRSSSKGRQDRYLGYIGEILTSLFFITNKEKFKIYHAEKKWLV